MATDSSLEGRHVSKFTQNSTKSLQNSREVDATSTCSRGMRSSFMSSTRFELFGRSKTKKFHLGLAPGFSASRIHRLSMLKSFT